MSSYVRLARLILSNEIHASDVARVLGISLTEAIDRMMAARAVGEW